jgi:peroxiredoxin Q/BCP
MPQPEPGQRAPDFKLPSSSGKTVSPKDYKGQNVVLYFYPKDDTEGCTVEACEFGALHPRIAKTGAVVLGVSPDAMESHTKFIKKFGLPFQLLADDGHKVADQYGVWVEKKMYGRTFMGLQRATFLIDAKGVIVKSWPKVKAKGHAAEVLLALKELGGK